MLFATLKTFIVFRVHEHMSLSVFFFFIMTRALLNPPPHLPSGDQQYVL